MKKTLTEAELRQLVAEGKTHGEIAKLIGFHRSTVSSACTVLGIESVVGRGRPKSVNHDVNAYLQDMRKGMTLKEIAQKHGCHVSSINTYLRRAGLPTCSLKLIRQEAAQQAA